MRRNRLAILLHDLASGGTELVALRLARAWREQGRQVDLICGSSSGSLKSLVDPGVNLIVPPQPIERGRGSRFLLGRAAAEICRHRGIGGLFIPGSSHFPALEGFAEKRRGEAPFIICKLSSVLRRDDRPLLLRWRALRSKAKLLSKADAVVALSPALANEANQLLGPLPLSIIEDPIFAREDGRPPHATDPRNGLIAAGRLAPAKDFGLAVEALACSKDRGLTLTILGEGPDRAALERQVERAGLTGRVTLPGNVPDIKPWLQSGRAFILSSRYEGYPAVAVEALSQGTPVIATNCTPAMREIITNPARGEVVGTRRAHDLARAVDRVLLRPLPALTDTEELWHRHQIDGAADHYLQLFDS